MAIAEELAEMRQELSSGLSRLAALLSDRKPAPAPKPDTFPSLGSLTPAGTPDQPAPELAAAPADSAPMARRFDSAPAATVEPKRFQQPVSREEMVRRFTITQGRKFTSSGRTRRLQPWEKPSRRERREARAFSSPNSSRPTKLDTPSPPATRPPRRPPSRSDSFAPPAPVTTLEGGAAADGPGSGRVVELLEQLVQAVEDLARKLPGGSGGMDAGSPGPLTTWHAAWEADPEAMERFPTASPSVNTSSLGGVRGAGGYGHGSAYRPTNKADFLEPSKRRVL